MKQIRKGGKKNKNTQHTHRTQHTRKDHTGAALGAYQQWRKIEEIVRLLFYFFLLPQPRVTFVKRSVQHEPWVVRKEKGEK